MNERRFPDLALTLSFEFQTYLMQHPEFADQIPAEAVVALQLARPGHEGSRPKAENTGIGRPRRQRTRTECAAGRRHRATGCRRSCRRGGPAEAARMAAGAAWGMTWPWKRTRLHELSGLEGDPEFNLWSKQMADSQERAGHKVVTVRLGPMTPPVSRIAKAELLAS